MNIKPITKNSIQTKDSADDIINKAFSNPTPGLTKTVKNNKIFYDADRAKISNEQKEALNKIYSYHKFSYNAPTNDISSIYNYELSIKTNKQIFRDYKDLLNKQNMTDELLIQNFYILENAAEYYRNLEQQTKNDLYLTLPSYSNIYLTPDLVTDTSALLEKLSNTPFYSKLKIPSPQGLKVEQTARSNDLFFIFDSTLGLNCDKLMLLNYFNEIKKAPNTPFYFNDSLGNQKTINADAIEKDTLAMNNSKLLDTVKTNSILISKQPYNRQIPNIFDKLVDQYTDSTSSYFSKFVNNEETDFVPLFYKISKYPAFPTLFKQSIQDAYIPVNLQADSEYIDNQILPSKLYNYSVSLIGFSCGFTYSYTDFVDAGAGGIHFQLNEKNIKPDIKLIEIPFLYDEARNNVTAPAIPDANIINLLDEPNKIKVFLSTKPSVEEPIFLNDSERTMMSRIESYSGKISYSNLDFQSFLVYKIDHAPNSYLDFKDNMVATLPKARDAFYDEIESNKKYYFMFRTTDGTYFSNPSEIYEVEIMNDKGALIPIIKAYRFEKQKNNALSDHAEFRYTVSLQPSYYQLVLKEVVKSSDTSFIGSKLAFDQAQFLNLQSVFENASSNNPKYKIRLISKATGKMIDINLKYKYVFK